MRVKQKLFTKLDFDCGGQALAVSNQSYYGCVIKFVTKIQQIIDYVKSKNSFSDFT